MSENEKAPLGATAKPCPIHLTNDTDTALQIGNVLEQYLLDTTKKATANGVFDEHADNDIQETICRISAAKVGIFGLFDTLHGADWHIKCLERDLVKAREEIAGWERCTTQQEKTIEAMGAKFYDHRKEVAELKLRLAGAQATISQLEAAVPVAENPEARAERLYAEKDARGIRSVEIRFY